MKNLTYQAYAANPELRAQLEREVRRLRAETAQAGLRAIFRAMFRRSPALTLKTA
jgi:hypothetical protein